MRYTLYAHEDVTEYLLAHTVLAQTDEQAIEVLELALQEAQAARDEEGGFGIIPDVIADQTLRTVKTY